MAALGRQAGVGAAQVLAHLGVAHREALDVRLVDHRLGPGRRGGRSSSQSNASSITTHLRDRGGAVLVVELEVGVVVAVGT